MAESPPISSCASHFGPVPETTEAHAWIIRAPLAAGLGGGRSILRPIPRSCGDRAHAQGLLSDRTAVAWSDRAGISRGWTGASPFGRPGLASATERPGARP